MGTFTFLHAADLHLDSPFEGLAAQHPAIAEALRDASLAAWDRLVDRAVAHRVAFVLLAGDLYDGPERGLRAQLRFRRGVERLAAAGIETFVVHGNHDPVEEGWSALRVLPPGLHVFAPGAPAAIPVVREGVPIAVVHGVSYATRHEKENLARRFARTTAPVPQIGLLHAHVQGQQGHDPYAPCSLQDLLATGLDYWALGHVHLRQTLATGRTWVVYPGNLQGRSCKPSECGEKGAVLATVVDGVVRSVEFLPLAPVRFERLVLDVGELADLAAVERALLDQVEALAAAPGVEGLVVRVELVGSGALHAELGRCGAGLLEALRDAVAGMRPFVAWSGLEIATSPGVDRAAALQRDDFAGALLRRLDGLRADPAALEALLARVDEPLPRGGAGRWLRPPDPEEARSLLAAAERFALERLGGGR